MYHITSEMPNDISVGRGDHMGKTHNFLILILYQTDLFFTDYPRFQNMYLWMFNWKCLLTWKMLWLDSLLMRCSFFWSTQALIVGHKRHDRPWITGAWLTGWLTWHMTISYCVQSRGSYLWFRCPVWRYKHWHFFLWPCTSFLHFLWCLKTFSMTAPIL